MIAEFIEYLRSTAPSWASERGLVYESIALGFRSQRQRRSWKAHQDKCRKQIADFLLSSPKAKKILILGSGHLMEIPKNIFEKPDLKFYLVDAVHPRSVRSWAKVKKNIELLHLDLCQPAKKILADLSLVDSLADGLDVDLVISCNLLSQLPLSMPEVRGPEILRQHLILLKVLAEKKVEVLLLTDFQRRHQSAEGEILERSSTIDGINLAQTLGHPVIETWPWSLAPLGEISRQFSVLLDVAAVRVPSQVKRAVMFEEQLADK